MGDGYCDVRDLFLTWLALTTLAEETPDSAERLDGAAVPGHVAVAFRDRCLLLRAAPVLRAAGEANDEARSIVSVA